MPSWHARFDTLSMPEPMSGCTLWLGSTTERGYGRFTVDSQRRGLAAHRVAYELFVGPIPAGLELDHTCRTPQCVNPNHLEPVTHAVNCRRAAVLGGFGRPPKGRVPAFVWAIGLAIASAGFCSVSGCDEPSPPPAPPSQSRPPVLPVEPAEPCPWEGTCAELELLDECDGWAVACGDGWRCVTLPEGFVCEVGSTGEESSDAE